MLIFKFSALRFGFVMVLLGAGTLLLAGCGPSNTFSLTKAEIEFQRQQNLLVKDATTERDMIAARAERDGGQAAVDAAAAQLTLRQRFQPLWLMTAFSSILGFMPLLVSSGAGAASRQSVGTAVVGGMIAATVFSLLFVPSFFVVFQSLAEIGSSSQDAAADPPEADATGDAED